MVVDTVLRRPQTRPVRCNSLTSYIARSSTHTEPPQRGIAPSYSGAEESLYTSFIRSRHEQGTHQFKGDAVVNLNDVQVQVRRPMRRSSMSGIETKPSKPSSSRRLNNHRRSVSPAKGLRKAGSFRRRRSNSPSRGGGGGGSKRRNGASKSPKPGSRSRRHKERPRSRSPQSPNPAASGSNSSPRSIGKDQQQQQEHSPATTQKSSRSRGKSPSRSSKSPRDKSPKLRRRSSLQYATVKEVLGDTLPDMSVGDCSSPNDTIQKQQQQQESLSSSSHPPPQPKQQESSDDDDCSVPALVDDSLVRETMNGYRHGQKWHLLDDTPGGHTPDGDFKVVNGIECPSDDARSWRPSEELEEDDDILYDEPLDHHPGVSSPIVEKTTAPVPDRFNPEFNSSDVWETELREVGVSRCPSGDISLLTDHHYELDTVSELASVSGRSHSLTSSVDNLNGDSKNGQLRPSAMPSRRNRRDGSASSPRQGYHGDESDIATGETSKRKHRRKKGMSGSRGPALPYDLQSPSTDREKSSSNRTSSSRRRGGTKAARPKANSTSRGSGSRRRVPKVVPASPASRGQDQVYSPLSSSMVTSPNSSSRFSASQVVQHQQQSLSSLRRDSVSRNNKSLGLHVARRIPSYDDNISLGASTLSTNFSTTQRTRGDNTVSTRSLFQSERMSISQSLKLPQRRRADSESDEEEFDNKLKKFMELPEENSGEPVGSPNIKTQIFPIASQEERDDPKEKRVLLKRPSGDGTGLLGDLNSAEEPQSNNQKLSSSSHHKSRRNQTRSTCKRPPRPPVSTNSFVQLNTNEDGVLVNHTRSPIADMESPLHIAGSADLAKNWQTPVLDDDDDEDEIGPSVKALALSSRKISVPVSPSKSKKKKKRLGLFRRTQSWKGAVALSDSED